MTESDYVTFIVQGRVPTYDAQFTPVVITYDAQFTPVVITYDAQFTPVVYGNYIVTFGVTDDIGGSLIAEVNSVEIITGDYVDASETVVFTATPDSEYSVKCWWFNNTLVNSTELTYEVTLDQDVSVYVEFEPNE